MLTPTGKTLLAGGGIFVAAGILFGNWPVVGAGALLVALVAGGSLAPEPAVVRTVDRHRIERGGRFEVTMEVDAPRGLGLVEIRQALPEEFELTSGNNFHVIPLGLRRRTHRFVFRVVAPKRGEWVLPPMEVRRVDPLGLHETPSEEVGEPVVLHVEPRPLPARLPRDLRTRAKRPFPDGDHARMGVATNDFRELREYVHGDPVRRINWKATARRVGSGAAQVPLVNETEWEGKKMVWIIVDGHPRLSVGTNLRDAREAAADAALSLAEIHLRRGYQVGMSLARSGNVPILRPGTGETQVRRARELLTRLGCAEAPSLMDVLERDAVHLHRGKPLVILVTRLAHADEDLRRALVRLGALGRIHGRNVVPGLVVDLDPAPWEEDPLDRVARAAVDADCIQAQAAARGAGLRVAKWRLEREPLERVLARGRIA